MYQKISFDCEAPRLCDLYAHGMDVFHTYNWWDTFVPEHKEELIKKIKHKYWFHQIGQETPERFVHTINQHLEEIMPYYNQLYSSELIKIDPLLNHALTMHGRSIENMVKAANTGTDRYSKAIRDFVGAKDTSGTANLNGKVTGSTHRQDSDTNDRTLSGTINEVEHTVGTVDTDEDTIRKNVQDTDSLEHATQTEDNQGNVDRNKDINSEETVDKTTSMNWGGTEIGKITENGTSDVSAKGSRDWTETTDDDSTTDTTSKLTENTDTDSQRDYSDTPQKKLNPEALRTDYLTNVTWDDTTSDHTADTTTKVTFADDITKEHNEETTDSSTTKNSNTTDTTKQKGGTDTEDTDATNRTEATENEHTTSTEHNNKQGDTKLDKTVTDDETIDRSQQERQDKYKTDDITKNENERENGSLTSDTTTTTGTVNSQTSTGHQQERETSANTELNSQTEKEEVEQTKDEGTTQTQTGFMNVSASALLEAFRKTFLNIDKMILDELRNDFSLVY